MKHLHALTASIVLALAAGCSREAPAPAPAPPSANQAASATWLGTPIAIASPAGAGARFPNFATSATGSTLVMSWVEPGASQGEFRLRYARWQPDRSWSTPLDAASGIDWFVNWADFPSVAPADTGPWAAHWLQQKPGGVYAYDVMVRVSNDAAQT